MDIIEKDLCPEDTSFELKDLEKGQSVDQFTNPTQDLEEDQAKDAGKMDEMELDLEILTSQPYEDRLELVLSDPGYYFRLIASQPPGFKEQVGIWLEQQSSGHRVIHLRSPNTQKPIKIGEGCASLELEDLFEMLRDRVASFKLPIRADSNPVDRPSKPHHTPVPEPMFGDYETKPISVSVEQADPTDFESTLSHQPHIHIYSIGLLSQLYLESPDRFIALRTGPGALTISLQQPLEPVIAFGGVTALSDLSQVILEQTANQAITTLLIGFSYKAPPHFQRVSLFMLKLDDNRDQVTDELTQIIAKGIESIEGNHQVTQVPVKHAPRPKRGLPQNAKCKSQVQAKTRPHIPKVNKHDPVPISLSKLVEILPSGQMADLDNLRELLGSATSRGTKGAGAPASPLLDNQYSLVIPWGSQDYIIQASLDELADLADLLTPGIMILGVDRLKEEWAKSFSKFIPISNTTDQEIITIFEALHQQLPESNAICSGVWAQVRDVINSQSAGSRMLFGYKAQYRLFLYNLGVPTTVKTQINALIDTLMSQKTVTDQPLTPERVSDNIAYPDAPVTVPEDLGRFPLYRRPKRPDPDRSARVPASLEPYIKDLQARLKQPEFLALNQMVQAAQTKSLLEGRITLEWAISTWNALGK